MKIQELLTGIAKHVGLTLEFPNDEPVRISGFQGGGSPFYLIKADQPDSELIYAILLKIGLVPVQNKPLQFPWYVNRPYENEQAGEIAYKSRRTLRQKLNPEWRAGLWALCAYQMIGCPREFRDFLERHPEKWKLMLLVFFGVLKTRIVRIFCNPR
jgi:hypothetical protein